MRHDDAGRAQLRERVGDPALDAVIQRAGRLVEQEDPRPVNERARQQDALDLPTGEPAFHRDRPHAHRQGPDVVGDARLFGRNPGRLSAESETGAKDILLERQAEQTPPLQDHAQLRANGATIKAAKILAVVENGPARRRFEAEEQAEDGGLTAAGRADQCHELTGPNLQREPRQHRLAAGGVAEIHRADLEGARQAARGDRPLHALRRARQDRRGVLQTRLERNQGECARREARRAADGLVERGEERDQRPQPDSVRPGVRPGNRGKEQGLCAESEPRHD